MANTMGFERYLVLTEESSWGVVNTVNADIFVPHTDYSVGVQNTSVQSELFVGGIDLIHNRQVSGSVSGSLTCPLWAHHQSSKSLAERLITWGFDRDVNFDLPSMTAEIAEPSTSTSKRHLGLRVNTMTISGSNQGMCEITLDLQGKSEEACSPIAIPALPAPRDFAFSGDGSGSFQGVQLLLDDGTTTVSLSDDIDIRSFSLTVNNNLQTYYTNEYFPTLIKGGTRRIDLTATFFKTSAVWDLLARASSSNITEFNAVLILKAPHGGTGTNTYTVINFDFDRLGFVNKSDSVGINQIQEQTINFVALNRLYTTEAMEITYSTV